MTSKPKDPLDVLQSMVDEVLVQTGKALRAANEDGAKGSGQVTASLKPKIEAASTVFHAALDDIECDIIAAKSVLMRDLNSLRAKKAPPPQLHPVAPIPKSQQQQQQQQQQVHVPPKPPQHTHVPPAKQTPVPVPVIPHIAQKQAPAALMGVDAGSPKISTTPIRPPQLGAIQKAAAASAAAAAAARKKESKPAAPFPDMGMSMGPVDLASKEKTASPKVASSKPTPKQVAAVAQGPPKPSSVIGGAGGGGGGQPKTSDSRVAPPPAGMMGSSVAGIAGMSSGTATAPELGPSTLPFTDYAFSLAPSSDPVDLASSSGPDPPASSGSLPTFGGYTTTTATTPNSTATATATATAVPVPAAASVAHPAPASAVPSATPAVSTTATTTTAAAAAVATPLQPSKPAAAPTRIGIPTGPAAGNLATMAPTGLAKMLKTEKTPAINDDLYNLGDGSGMDLGPDNMGAGGVDTNNFDDMFYADEGYDTAAYFGLE